ncbi:MAG: Fur family transcriptional regulator [Desulfovibrio sp.]|jgi:Fur family ferric uptake transcriptional regulator|nr:Fur family transcriptional regulator [Desulfovibrio sp.]
MNPQHHIFKEYLVANGLKLTQQRKLILNVFITLDQAVSPEELFHEVHGLDQGISLSTVYRTLKHLLQSGVARCMLQSDGVTRYEGVTGHYCRLVCEHCGKSLPLDNPYLHCLQHEAARQEGFHLYECVMELRGICKSCRDRLDRADARPDWQAETPDTPHLPERPGYIHCGQCHGPHKQKKGRST